MADTVGKLGRGGLPLRHALHEAAAKGPSWPAVHRVPCRLSSCHVVYSLPSAGPLSPRLHSTAPGAYSSGSSPSGKPLLWPHSSLTTIVCPQPPLYLYLCFLFPSKLSHFCLSVDKHPLFPLTAGPLPLHFLSLDFFILPVYTNFL